MGVSDPSKKTLFVVAVLCVASLLLFHFSLSTIIHSVHSITVDNAFLRSEGDEQTRRVCSRDLSYRIPTCASVGLSVTLEVRSPKNVTNSEDDTGKPTCN